MLRTQRWMMMRRRRVMGRNGLLKKKVSEGALKLKLMTSRRTRKTRARALTKPMKLIKTSTLSKRTRSSK